MHFAAGGLGSAEGIRRSFRPRFGLAFPVARGLAHPAPQTRCNCSRTAAATPAGDMAGAGGFGSHPGFFVRGRRLSASKLSGQGGGPGVQDQTKSVFLCAFGFERGGFLPSATTGLARKFASSGTHAARNDSVGAHTAGAVGKPSPGILRGNAGGGA